MGCCLTGRVPNLRGVLLLVGLLLGGCSPPPVALPPNAAAVVGQAKEVLAELPVKGRAPLTGYRREEFGDGWADLDGNGCNTREEVLRRDLREVRLAGTCEVDAGVLIDPYSGAAIQFRRGPAADEVQVDHVVALANAWQSGASQWTPGQRGRFANDTGGLLAVAGSLNQRKGAGDAATWLPPNKAFRCQYAALQVVIKHRWGLWVTPQERAALQRVLAGC